MIGPDRFQELAQRRQRQARQRNEAYSQPLSVAEEVIVEVLAGMPRERVGRLVAEAARLRNAARQAEGEHADGETGDTGAND